MPTTTAPRRVLAVVAAGCLLLTGPVPAHAQDGDAPTTVAGMLLRYQELSRRAEQASEESTALQERLVAAREQVRVLDEAIDQLSGQARDLGAEAERQQAAGDLSAALRRSVPDDYLSALFGARSVEDFLVIADPGGGPSEASLRELEEVRGRIGRLREEAAESADSAAALADQQAATATRLDEQITLVKSTLDALPPQQRALLSAVGAAPAEIMVTGDVGPVVAFALAQRGKPYVWGAEGPNSYDCSGLVQAAFASTGIAVPRVSIDQSRVGLAVARSEARAGDLVFYYQPVHHVAIVIDHDHVVHAPTFGEPVKVSALDSVGPVTVIRRITG